MDPILFVLFVCLVSMAALIIVEIVSTMYRARTWRLRLISPRAADLYLAELAELVAAGAMTAWKARVTYEARLGAWVEGTYYPVAWRQVLEEAAWDYQIDTWQHKPGKPYYGPTWTLEGDGENDE